MPELRLLLPSFLALSIWSLGASALFGANAPLSVTVISPNKKLSFERDVYPILKANCISCHNKTSSKAGLNMETPDLMRKGGESGAGIVAGKATESPIFQAAVHTWDSVMPPKGNKAGASNLTADELGILQAWIDRGAKGQLSKHKEITWQPLPPGLNPIYATAISGDGRWAACARANQVSLYDLGTRQLSARLTDVALIQAGLYKNAGVAHRDVVQSLAFSPDGIRLASGSYQEVKIWKRQSVQDPSRSLVAVNDAAGAKLVAAAIKVDPASVLALRADGKRFATGGADGVVRVWDVVAKKAVLEIRSDFTTSRFQAGKLWEAGRQQLEMIYQSETARLAELEIKSLDDQLKKTNEAIVAAKKLVVDKGKLAQTAKATALKKIPDLEAQLAKLKAEKPDPALDKRIEAIGEQLALAKRDEDDAVAAAKAAEDQVVDAEAEIKTIEKAKQNATDSIAASKVAHEAADKLMIQLKGEATKPQVLDPNKDGVKTLAFSEDGQMLTAVTVSGVSKQWSAETGAPLEMAGANGRGQFVWVLERVIGGKESTLVDRVNALRFSADGKTLVTGSGEPSRSGDIAFWDVATGKELQTWREKHTDSVLSLDLSPDGKLLASGGADRSAKVFEIATGKQVRNLEGHSHHVLGVAFRADGRMLATAGADNVVKVWDLSTGEKKRNLDGWDKEVTSIQFLGPSDQMLMSAGDNQVSWIKDNGNVVKALTGLPDFMSSAGSTRLGDVIAAGGQDSVLRVWTTADGKELATFKAE